MNRPDMEQIAEEAAEKAIHKFFISLGIDASDPKAIIALQDDFRHVRAWRESTEAAKQHALKTIIGVLLTGALGWIGLMFWRHQ